MAEWLYWFVAGYVAVRWFRQSRAMGLDPWWFSVLGSIVVGILWPLAVAKAALFGDMKQEKKT